MMGLILRMAAFEDLLCTVSCAKWTQGEGTYPEPLTIDRQSDSKVKLLTVAILLSSWKFTASMFTRNVFLI